VEAVGIEDRATVSAEDRATQSKGKTRGRSDRASKGTTASAKARRAHFVPDVHEVIRDALGALRAV
jgi:hypothetical protein